MKDNDKGNGKSKDLNEVLADRGCMIVLYVTGVVHELCDLGMLTTRIGLSVGGVATWDQLRATGFRPTRAEIDGCLESFRRFGLAVEQDVAGLVERFDEIRARTTAAEA